jgi:hypothetical protein
MDAPSPSVVVTTRSDAGVVAEFDDDAGLGVVEAMSGERYPFHCTAVADGSRHVDVGAPVRFALAPAHAGRIEARDLVVTAAAPA